jgi:hypothetical protein
MISALLAASPRGFSQDIRGNLSVYVLVFIHMATWMISIRADVFANWTLPWAWDLIRFGTCRAGWMRLRDGLAKTARMLPSSVWGLPSA